MKDQGRKKERTQEAFEKQGMQVIVKNSLYNQNNCMSVHRLSNFLKI